MTRGAAPTLTQPWILFDSPIGTCGIVWSDAGISRLRLPTASRCASRESLLDGLSVNSEETRLDDAPAWTRDAIARLQGHLSGHADPLTDIALDLSPLPDFSRRVCIEARAIAPGTTVTYAELARRCGSPGAARAVGQAMARNPIPLLVPCHRVLGAGGSPGGFSAPGALVTKTRLLRIEGVELVAGDAEPRLPFDDAWLERHSSDSL